MKKLNPDHVAAVIAAINQAPYFKLLSMPLKQMGTGFALAEIEITKKHLNPFGGIHGGVYASVIDTVAYWSVYCELEENVGMISIDLKIDFLGPISEGLMRVEGRSIKIGKTMCLGEATAKDENGRWLAHGTSKMMITKGLQTIEDALNFSGVKKLPPKFI